MANEYDQLLLNPPGPEGSKGKWLMRCEFRLLFLFKLKYLGHETIKTDFGKIKCIKFRPYVMAGRVFKEEESLTLWVTADGNKVPIKIKADLDVGSLRADLVALKGLKHPFEIQF